MADLQSELDNEVGSLFLRPGEIGEVIENMKHVFSWVCVGGLLVCVRHIPRPDKDHEKTCRSVYSKTPCFCLLSIHFVNPVAKATFWARGGRAANKTTVE